MAKADKRFDSLPILDKAEDFEEWKRDVTIWKAITSIEDAKQGPVLYRSLEGQAKKACCNIKVEEICSANGYKLIMDKLAEVFEKDQEQELFNRCREFETYKRTNESIGQYVSEFERLHERINGDDMKYPDSVLAYKLLINANISEEKQQMCRATMGTLSFENIKKQLKVIHDATGMNSKSVKSETSEVVVKEEPVFETENFFGNAQRGFWRGNRGTRNSARGAYRGNYGARGNQRKFLEETDQEQGKQRDNTGTSMKKKNPTDKYGRITRCGFCQSIYHWVRDCPDKDEEHIGLFTNQNQQSHMPQLLHETINCAILDCGCVKTVCGSMWYEKYKETLTDEEKRRITEEKSSTRFRFGVGGPIYVSERKVKFPAMLGSKKVTIESDIIDCELPLLLSKESMKKAETAINFKDDKVSMLGQTLDLKFTTSGHYAIPLGIADEKKKVQSVFINIEELDGDSKRKACQKLHVQFGHARTERIHSLLKDAKISDKEIFDLVKEAEENCQTCIKYKRPKARPVVGLSLARDFNENVSMDIKFYKTIPWLHLIDHATRFSAACVVGNKKKDTIIENIFRHWISIFGSPKSILSDNGCEFQNVAMRELGDLLNIEVKTTAAEAPWSNGITERHNALIGSMIDKLIDSQHCSLEMALAWSVNAKNSLSNVYGYSPYQLVFGKNPNVPSILTDKIPALEGVTSSQVIADHLNAITAARKAYVEAESCGKIKRALVRKTRPVTSFIFETGQKVYFKRRDDDTWKGPATVIGKEKSQIFIKHGGIYARVNPCHLMHVNNEDNRAEDNRIENKEVQAIEEESSSETETEKKEENKGELTTNQDEESSSENESYEQEDIEERAEIEGDEEENSKPLVPTKGSMIRYRMRDSDIYEEAKVLGKAGKATGKNKFWINVEQADGQLKSLNLEHVENLEISEEVVLLSLKDSYEDVDVKQAMANEIQNWRHHDVFTEVEDEGQPGVSCRWVITEKYKEGERCIKARLVARGFEEAEMDRIRKDSPTCGKDSLRLCLTLLATMGWQINSLDVKAAFLQGSPIEREVFIIPPREADTNKVWKLKKTVYGLADASRTWYLRVREELEKFGVLVSRYDEAIFFWRTESGLEGLICCHVDDFLWGGTMKFKEEVIDKTKQTFVISKEDQSDLKYIGLELKQSMDKITVSQKKYIESLDEIRLERKLGNEEELNKKEKRMLRGAVGQLNWIAFQTRPDMAFDACNTAVSLKNATFKDVKNANKSIRKAKTNEVKIEFKNIGDLKKGEIICYTDASFRNLKGESSQGGHIIFLKGSKTFSPITWQSKKIKRIVKSTLASEALALDDAADSCFYLKTLLQEITGQNSGFPITLKTDSRNLYDAVHSTKTLEDRRLKIDICSLRQKLAKGEIQTIEWIRKDYQLADCLTKLEAPTSKLIEVLRGSLHI